MLETNLNDRYGNLNAKYIKYVKNLCFNLQIIIDKIKVDSVIIRIISILTKTVYSNLQISVKFKIKLCLN